MNVLLTGAFGNIGTSLIKNLIMKSNPGIKLRCFDIKNKNNLKKSSIFKDNIEVFWGDIRDSNDVLGAVKDQDYIIHLAFIMPPLSETDPDLAFSTNIQGTKNIIEMSKKSSSHIPRILFGSSVSVFGPIKPDKKPPLKSYDKVKASDNYTKHKIECEKIVMDSGLDWIITRFGVTPSKEFSPDYASMIFEVPLDARIEFIHTMDVGLALLNTIGCKACLKKILLIGGGKECQLYQREFLFSFLDAYGIGRLPESAFSDKPYYTDWLDTKESQKLLNYQTRTFDDYISDIKKEIGLRRYFTRIIRPIALRLLLSKSPYYKK